MSQDQVNDYHGEVWVSRLREEVAERPEQPKRQTKAKKDGFIHSLNSSNKVLQQYLDKVPKGIANAAAKWGIDLPPSQLAMLNRPLCKGNYPMYLPQSTAGASSKMNTKKLNDRTDAEKKQYYIDNFNIHIVPKSPRFGSNIAAATSRNYEQAFRTLWNFLAFLGRYDEMIIMLPHPPALEDNVLPSISPSTVKEYIMHRFNEPFSDLHMDGDQTKGHLLDCTGVQILCEGTTNNYKWFDSIFAAVHYVHKKAKKEERYKPACAVCLQLTSEAPCSAHRGNGKTRIHYVRSKGDPTKSMEVEELRKWLEEESKRREYKPKRRSPFLPHDMTKFHEYLDHKSFDIVELMYYVVLLDAIHLGARWDSYHKVKVEDFESTSQHWVVFMNGYFTNFAQRIKEKTDSDVTIYRIHFDDTIKNRCLARHFLVFHHCSGVRSGFVFPEEGELRRAHLALAGDKNSEWAAQEPMDYEKFCARIENWKKQVKGSENANWGPHSTRITKYLWSFLGGADLELAAKAARHKCMKMAIQYLQDSASIRDLLKEHPQLREIHKVAPFRDDIVMGNGENMERALLELPNRKTSCRSLKELCKVFVEDMLHVPPSHEKYFDPEYLLKLSYGVDLQRNGWENEDPLSSLIKTLVPENRQYTILQSLDQSRKQDRDIVKEAIRDKEIAQRAVDRMRQQQQQQLSQQSPPKSDKTEEIRQLQSKVRQLEHTVAEKEKQVQLGLLQARVVAGWSIPHKTAVESRLEKWWQETEECFYSGERPVRPNFDLILQPPGGNPTSPRPIPLDTAPAGVLSPVEDTHRHHQRKVTPSPHNNRAAAPLEFENQAKKGHALAPNNSKRQRVEEQHAASPVIIDDTNNPREHLVGADNTINDGVVPCSQFLQKQSHGIGQTVRLMSSGRERITKAKGLPKAELLLDLIDEITELGSAPKNSPIRAYEVGKSQLAKGLPRVEQNSLNSFLYRNLCPIYHHYSVCCKGKRENFLNNIPENFAPANYLLRLNCSPCDESNWKSKSRAKCNAKKMSITRQEHFAWLQAERDKLVEDSCN